MTKIAVGFVLGPGKFQKGYRGKGTAMTSAGQVDVDALTGAPTLSIVFGIADKQAIVMRKKKATGYEYEQVDPDNIGAMKTEGYEVVSSGKTSIRTLGPASGGTAVAASSQSKILHVKLNASIAYTWSQPIEVYNRSAAGRTRLVQVDGTPANGDEMVQRASGFILNTAYAAFPPGAYIPINGIKAKFRMSAATAPTATSPGNSGIYSSFAGDSAWT